MSSKEITIRGNFFNFSEPNGEENGMDKLFAYQKSIIDQQKVDNIEAGGNVLRITFLEKQKVNEASINHYWVGVLEKLDVTSEGEIAKLDGSRTKYAAGPDEGTIVNTGFLYYPLTKTLLLHKKYGGVNDKSFGIFIRKLIKYTEICSQPSKFVMDVVPDVEKLARLSNSSAIESVEYSFAMPKNLDINKLENRSILGDMALAHSLGADRIKVIISAKEQGMKVLKTFNKIKSLAQLGENVSTLKAVSKHGDITEPLDLLSDRFTDYIRVKLDKNQKETATLIMDSLQKIFLNQKTLIETMYANSDD
ncbi:hypothetical protein [Bacillus atrophaeus]|uniref:hypothetical protein n=1 Tax=Bacillus atrophaeus TaxID=1452 RepID=UPI00227ECF6E|nr:hypothetical protein [Bacillus atrophaeus]MCY8944194.1 hypothetical protein [Bacillus atrophaeus]